MPKIVLKYKSPEFADTSEKITTKNCEMPGCTETGDHRAPKHRGLDEHYTFCFDHAREYNKAWNFFDGMSNSEVEDYMTSSIYGNRPTWKYGVDGKTPEEELFREAQNHYFNSEEKTHQKHSEQKNRTLYGDRTTPEHEAMALMGLEPPVELEDIKARYKKLAKKYHPDLNRDNPDAEELLKKINMAYTILKLAFEDFQKLPQQ